MWELAVSYPPYLEIGVAVTICVLLIPAVKVVVDWIHPPQIHPQPLNVRLEEKFATKQELEKLEKDLNAQMKDMRAYVHDEIHKVRADIASRLEEASVARGGLHDRMNAYVEVLYEMRGTLNAVKESLKR